MHQPTAEQVQDMINKIKADHPDGTIKLPEWFNPIMTSIGINLGVDVMQGKQPIGGAIVTAMKLAFTIGVRANERKWITGAKNKIKAASNES